MRYSSLFLALLACACAPAASTGSAPDAGSADAGTVLTLSDNPTLPELLAYWDSLLCHTYACVKHERETPATCAAALASTEYPFDAFRRTRAEVRTGRGIYDAEAGKKCAALLNLIDPSADCYGQDVPMPWQATQAFDAACGNLIIGQVAPGAACDFDKECVAGAGCRFDYDNTGKCFGTCVHWLQPGDDCSQKPMDCAPASYCDGSVCKARQLKADGSFCVDASECRSGKCFDYACKTTSDFQGECVGNEDCGAGLYCRALPPSTGRLGVCQVPALTGTACGYAVKCAGNEACAGYAGKYMGGTKDGVCQVRPNGVGEACVPLPDGYDFSDTGCFADLTCNPATGKCEEPPPVGSPCASPNRCGADAWCDAGTCRAKKADGESANGFAECLHNWDQNRKVCFSSADDQRCLMR